MGAQLGNSGAFSDINMTPLIDIVLVVLIIMMVNIPIQIEEMGLKLPSPLPPPPPPDVPVEQLVIAIIVRPAAWHAFGLKPEQKRFVEQVTQSRDDVVLASMGVPYVLEDFPSAAVRICTYSDVPVSQQALAEFLLRGSEPGARGAMPTALRGHETR